MIRKFILIILLFTTARTHSQFNKLLEGIVPKANVFKELKGEFKPVKYEGKVNGKNELPYLFSFSASNFSIQFYRIKQSELSDSSCNYFMINTQRFNLKDQFTNDFACDLDVSTFKVYIGTMGGVKYLLISGINSGSGTSTTSVVLNLFDVTNVKKIKYYPLWSKFGSDKLFSDSNKDGGLDFLEIRPYKDRDHFKATLNCLDKNGFVRVENTYLILKYVGDSLKVIKSNNIAN